VTINSRKIKFADISDYYYDQGGYNGFSLVSKDNKETCEPEPCKESFTEIYWDKVDLAHSKKKIILFKDEDLTKKWATQAQNLLNVVENKMITPLSRVTYHHETKKGEHNQWNGEDETFEVHRLIIEVFSPLWFKNGPMIHLFCLLVRNASLISANRKKWDTIIDTLRASYNDGSQFKTARYVIESLIRKRGELSLTDQMHMGICDYANQYM
jgi:hypothetical protein